MNVLRLLVLGLVAVQSAMSAAPASAAAIPQSPILFNKQNHLLPGNLVNPVTPDSFNYPANVNLKVERETKSRRGGQPPDEFHDKAKINPAPAVPPTLTLEIGKEDKQVKTFNFDHLHFHRTAEHLETQDLNNLYSMELHIVHTRPKDGPNDTLPTNAVVGRWIDVILDPVGPGLNPNFGHNADLKNLFDAYAGYIPAGANAVPNFNMQKLLPGPGNFEYYRYLGSLTAGQKQIAGQSADVLLWNNLPGPPVLAPNETWVSDTAVEWVMFEKPLTISLAQWTQYTSFIFDVDNHFGAQYSRSPFTNLFAVWDLTNPHYLRYVAIPEPGAVCLLAVAGVVATLRMRCRGKKP